MMKRYLKISVIFLCLLVFPVFAQDFGEPDLTKNEKILTAIEQNLQKNNLLPADISDDLKIVNGIQSEMSQAKLYYQDKLQSVQKRLDALGSVPESGIKEPAADAEVILLAVDYLKSLGLNDLEVEINSLGCPECREEYKKKIKEVLKPEFDNLCEDCQNRYEKNPLRLLDCKVESCKEIFAKPEIQKVIQSDFICEECAEHYKDVKSYLDKLKIKYVENKLLVRGLDYYNRTVFEIKSNNLGSQNAVCGGGRYDSLVKNLGGEDTPAVGWAMGMERLNSLLPEIEPEKLDGYIVSNSPADALELAEELRGQGLKIEFDLANKKFTKQLEKASKIAKFALILGEDEINTGKVSIKNLSTSKQITVDRKEVTSEIKG